MKTINVTITQVGEWAPGGTPIVKSCGHTDTLVPYMAPPNVGEWAVCWLSHDDPSIAPDGGRREGQPGA